MTPEQTTENVTETKEVKTDGGQANNSAPKVWNSPYFLCSSDKVISVDMTIGFLDNLIGLLTDLSINKALWIVESLTRNVQAKLSQEVELPEFVSNPNTEEDAKTI